MYNKDLNTLNALIDSSISEAYNNINNNLLSDTRFFLNHMEIIKHQRDILENLYSYVSQLSSTPPQAHIISAFILTTDTQYEKTGDKKIKKISYPTRKIIRQLPSRHLLIAHVQKHKPSFFVFL